MSSRSGGLLELVARGKKDIFFTQNPKVSFFHSVYVKSAAFTKEIYVARPRNVPEWGRYVDFDIDHRGDILRNFHLRISLPTWLPESVVAINNNGIVTDLSGVSYGYCNNVGFQMIDRIQLLMDNVLIHDLYGEYLDWRLRMSYEFGTTYLYNATVGSRAETPLAIGRSSTQGALRVPLPLLGWNELLDPGLPLTALRNCRFRIRVHIRPYRDILTASDGRLSPNPFGILLKAQTTANSRFQTWLEKTLPASCMRNLDISLETTNLYLANNVNVWFKATGFVFPFRHVQFRPYTIEDNIMNAVANGSPISIPVKLDFSGPADRSLIGFRSDASTLAGQRNVLVPPPCGNGEVCDPTYVASLRLNIANIDRVDNWEPAVYREVMSYWKNRRVPLRLGSENNPDDIYCMTFGEWDKGEPAGTLSFSRAVLPTLYITPARAMWDARNISRRVFVLIYCESWNIYEVSNGRGRLLFDDS